MGEGWLNFPRNLGLCIFRDMRLTLLRSGCSLGLSPNPLLSPGNKPFKQWYPLPQPSYTPAHQPGSMQGERRMKSLSPSAPFIKLAHQQERRGAWTRMEKENTASVPGLQLQSFSCSPGPLQGLRGAHSFCSVPWKNSANRVLHLFPAQPTRSEQS